MFECVFRVIQVQLEELVFEAWMDAMAPRGGEEILEILDNKDQMENRSELVQLITKSVI